MAKNSFNRILLSVDFSVHSDRAAEYALRLAQQNDATIHLVHVVHVSDDIVPLVSSRDFEKKAIRNAEATLKDFAAKKLKGYEKVYPQVLSGVPYKELLDYIKSSKCDLVVIGSYGKGSLDRLIVGSTTERIMRKSTCPVLVVPPAKR